MLFEAKKPASRLITSQGGELIADWVDLSITLKPKTMSGSLLTEAQLLRDAKGHGVVLEKKL